MDQVVDAATNAGNEAYKLGEQGVNYVSGMSGYLLCSRAIRCTPFKVNRG